MPDTAALQTALDALRGAIRIVPLSATQIAPGERFTVSIQPATAGEAILANDVLPLSALTTALTVGILQNGTPVTLPANTPLQIQDLTVPIPFPITLIVAWSLVRRIDANGGPTDIPIDGFQAEGLNAPLASFVFPPPLVELTAQAVDPFELILKAAVTLRIDIPGVSPIESPTNPTDLVPLELPIRLEPLLVPTVLVLSRNHDFLVDDPSKKLEDRREGGALVVVGARSPIRNVEQLQAALGRIDVVLSAVGRLANLILPAPLGDFLKAVRRLSELFLQPQIEVVAANRIANLNRITVIQRDPLHNDIEGELEMSALFLLTTPLVSLYGIDTPATAQGGAFFFNKRDFKPEKGRLAVRPGDAGFAFIRNLAREELVVEPGDAVADATTEPKKTFENAFRSMLLLEPRQPVPEGFRDLLEQLFPNLFGGIGALPGNVTAPGGARAPAGTPHTAPRLAMSRRPVCAAPRVRNVSR